MRIVLSLLLASSLLYAQTPNPEDGEIPEVLNFVAPAYPRAAKDQRIMGRTATAITVAPEGRVTDVKTITAHPVFADYVVSALRQWRFRPSHAAHKLNVSVEFELLDDCSEGTDKHTITSETYLSAELPTVVHVKTAARCIETSDTSSSKQRH